MERRAVNPWSWGERFALAQAIEVSKPERFLICAGQTSVDETGAPVHAGDMRAQLGQALDNVETVLAEAGYDFADVVRLMIYTTDVDAFFEHIDVLKERQGPNHLPGVLAGVARLASPELLIELEVTAVK